MHLKKVEIKKCILGSYLNFGSGQNGVVEEVAGDGIRKNLTIVFYLINKIILKGIQGVRTPTC